MRSGALSTTPRAVEYLLPLFGCALLVVSCLIYSTRKPGWLDEIGTWVYINDPSYAHMLDSMIVADTVPPLFYTLAQGWRHIFGGDLLALRLFSCLGMCSAFLLLWKLVRSAYGYWSTALSTFTLFGLSYHLLYQNAEARFYGLLMALVALLALEYQALCRAERPPRGVIVGAALTFAALVMIHPFGFIYTGLMVCALATQDSVVLKRRRWRLYASLLVGWLVFVPWLIGPFRTQMQVISAHNWVAVPNLQDLVEMYTQGFSATLPATLIGIGALVVLTRFLRRRRRTGYFVALPRTFTPTPDQRTLLIFGAWLLTTPLLAFGLSHAVTSVFVDRYMLPASVGAVIVLGQLCTLLTPLPKADKPLRVSLALRALPIAFLYLCFAVPLAYAAIPPLLTAAGSEDGQYGYTDLPIALLSSNTYFTRAYYTVTDAAPTNRYFFLQDQHVAYDSQTPALNAFLDYQLMAGLKRNYPTLWQNATHILDYSQFLDTYPRFLIVHEPQRRWFETRIANNPAYTYTTLGPTDSPYFAGLILDLILVEKKTALSDRFTITPKNAR